VFGGSIVAIESDKRLAPDGSARRDTQYFEVMDLTSGEMVEYALPHHLYFLAAMNQADTSVEPLDVAFLRRWAPFKLNPNTAVLRRYFGLDTNPSDLPAIPTAHDHVYEAAVQAFAVINRRISLGRGAEFQIGHGVFMTDESPPKEREPALAFVAENWQLVRAHIDEVFFGDLRGVAAVLNVGASNHPHPYKLVDVSFGDEPRLELTGPERVDSGTIYELMIAIGG
jgi:5-methylcytosine-specific restriction protein B